MMQKEQWQGFEGRLWKEEINVRDFIQNNYTPYEGDSSFLADPTEATNQLWGKLQELQKEERAKGGVLDMETEVVSSLTAYGPGYICEELKDKEQVVGLQTDKPLKRAFMPFGGIKMAEEACKTYGYEPNPKFHKIFTDYHKTHNQAVFDAYTPEMKKARHNKILTGLPDTYGRGRIVGDYRRVALYGIDLLIAMKQDDLANCGYGSNNTSSDSSNSGSGGYVIPSGGLTPSKGRIWYNGHTETYYSQKVLPGGGLAIPGRHIASDGTIRDADGYIVLASDDYPRGTVVETSLGAGKVYDTGSGSGNIDLYTDW